MRLCLVPCVFHFFYEKCWFVGVFVGGLRPTLVCASRSSVVLDEGGTGVFFMCFFVFSVLVVGPSSIHPSCV